MARILKLDKTSGEIISTAEKFYSDRNLEMDEATFPGSIAFIDEATTCLLGELWKKIEKKGGAGLGSAFLRKLDDYGEIAGKYVWRQYDQWALFTAALNRNMLQDFILLGVSSCYCASAELQMKNKVNSHTEILATMTKLAGDFIRQKTKNEELETFVDSIGFPAFIHDLVTCFEDRRMKIYNDLGII